MDNNQDYLIIDPFINTFARVDDLKELTKAYPRIKEKVNFICGFAEHLPLLSKTFDHVHMRSMIDHVYNAELAVAEAYRVLKKGGILVIASYMEGGENGKLSIKEKIKHKLEFFGKTFQILLKDHHLWHPTYKEMINLLEDTNFKIKSIHWLTGLKNVCYIEAIK